MGNENRFIFLEACAVSLLSCFLLLNLGANFYDDWPNHLWMIGYGGSYFREHFNFPLVFNTNQYVGIPFPIFYGFGFYRVFALLAGICSPDLSVRLVAFLFFLTQHFLIILTLLKMKIARWFSSSVAWVVTLSIYPLTNLYNRSALTEFFATLALTISVCLLFLMILESNLYRRSIVGILFALFFGFSSLSHPITAMYGALFLALFFVPFLFIVWKNIDKKIEFLGVGFLSVVCVCLIASPWVYATHQFIGQIYISKYISGVVFYRDSLDWFWSRISPIPFDRRALGGISGVSTPFLDAQTNVFLLGLWVLSYVLNGSLFRIRGFKLAHVFVIFTFILWAFFLRASVSDEFISHFTSIMKLIQFAYRFVTYQNLTALCGVLSIGFFMRNRNYFGERIGIAKTTTLILIGLATNAYIIKMIHGSAIKSQGEVKIWSTAESRNAFLNLPSNFYGLSDYTVSNGYETLELKKVENSPQVRFEPGKNLEFGVLHPLEIEVSQPGWYRTNVLTFPWNHLTLNGKEVQDKKSVHDGSAPVLSVFIPKGKNQISYSFDVPRPWRLLNKISVGLILCLFLALFALGLRVRTGRTS